MKVFFFFKKKKRKKRFLERVLWSKVFHGYEWVRVPNTDVGVGEGVLWLGTPHGFTLSSQGERYPWSSLVLCVW